MPYIEGETLREKLNRETQLGVDEAVKITTEIADALDYAHRHGVIHRDIKPENILLHDGRPMVMDFGIALAVSAAAGGRMTETGLSLGTPHYMSPEQATADKEITGRSDVYSLARVLYEMLAGEPPHTGSSAQQIIMKIVTEEAAPVTRLRKSCAGECDGGTGQGAGEAARRPVREREGVCGRAGRSALLDGGRGRRCGCARRRTSVEVPGARCRRARRGPARRGPMGMAAAASGGGRPARTADVRAGRFQLLRHQRLLRAVGRRFGRWPTHRLHRADGRHHDAVPAGSRRRRCPSGSRNGKWRDPVPVPRRALAGVPASGNADEGGRDQRRRAHEHRLRRRAKGAGRVVGR